MAIKTCPNGHHYNTEDNPTCPYCERVSNGGFNWFESESDNKTVSINTPEIQDENIDFAVRSDNNRNDLFDSDFSDSDKTKVLPPEKDLESSDYIPQIDPEETQIKRDKDKSQSQPVVGWLVCIEGSDKGKDFCLRGAKNTIGRRSDSSVRLTDSKISRDGFPALIVYDDRKSHKFYLASGDAASHNNVELGGNILLGQSIINPYDEIRIEDTVLVFVPFCCDEFFWE